MNVVHSGEAYSLLIYINLCLIHTLTGPTGQSILPVINKLVPIVVLDGRV